MDPKAIEAFVAPAFLLIGLSHVTQPHVWVRFFDLVRQSRAGAAIVPMYTLPFGLLLVVFHNQWVWGWPVVLTFCGWSLTFKSALYLIVPGLADRMLKSDMARSPRSYQIAGAVMALFAAVLTWRAWT